MIDLVRKKKTQALGDRNEMKKEKMQSSKSLPLLEACSYLAL